MLGLPEELKLGGDNHTKLRTTTKVRMTHLYPNP